MSCITSPPPNSDEPSGQHGPGASPPSTLASPCCVSKRSAPNSGQDPDLYVWTRCCLMCHPIPMHLLFPPKLRPSDTLRIIAPSRSLAIIDLAIRKRATARLASLGFQVTFGAHVEERDAFDSTSVAARIADLHAAFADPDGVLSVSCGNACRTERRVRPHGAGRPAQAEAPPRRPGWAGHRRG